MDSMDAKTKERFTKLMALSGSDNDHEALLALRKAQILETENISWEGLLVSKTIYIEANKEKTAPKREIFRFDKIPKMAKNDESKGIFKDIKKKFSILDGKDFDPDTARFLKSLHTHWMLKGTLSEKHLYCLTQTTVLIMLLFSSFVTTNLPK
jgi:hypothetical protein